MTLDKHIFYNYIHNLTDQKKEVKKMSKILPQRNQYITECQDKFREVQKDNKLLIHYILDKPKEYREFEEQLKVLRDQEKFDDVTFNRILKEYYFQHPIKTGNRIGVLVAAKPDGSDHPLMGWSLCNVKRDKFNKYIGICKALDRLQHGNPMIDDGTFFIPTTIEYELERFSERVERYFKIVPVPVAANSTNTVIPPTTYTASIEP